MVIDETMYEDEILEHHGIPGQKWGTMNGPPYPLDPNKDYSKAELRAMRKEARKEARKENRRKKKIAKKDEIEKQKTEEEEKLEKEEAKNRAVVSGSASEVEKYKDMMTNEELRLAQERVRLYQELNNLKLTDLRQNNAKIQEEIDRISKENNLRDQKLKEKYGPGKGEAALEKTARISEKIGRIAKAATSAGVAAKTWSGAMDEIKKNKTSNNESKSKKDDETSSKDKTTGAKGIKGLAWNVATGKAQEKANKASVDAMNAKAKAKAAKKAAKEIKKFKGSFEKERERFRKVKVKKMGVDRGSFDNFVDAEFDSDIKYSSMTPAVKKASQSSNNTLKYLYNNLSLPYKE